MRRSLGAAPPVGPVTSAWDIPPDPLEHRGQVPIITEFVRFQRCLGRFMVGRMAQRLHPIPRGGFDPVSLPIRTSEKCWQMYPEPLDSIPPLGLN